ncbi:LacI family DNA-binding transcriptional regulator [Glutamicibacter sp. PS]|uniref:LacI family DNA-binding transcriptional regulator n=1 Tax=Glutamicibacter TaxID=1742989 RepID=UPI00284E6F8C|nr:LacI family DNA-binding transcriptional regulator [Glutamicibacter sp. PS]MDR4534375.1 LacI family transcriptional regulator [Glutamicibacter sp. PS]
MSLQLASGRRPTIIDVAERAGVSKSLASRALRGDPGVSEASRLLVLDAAEDLGYRPNSAARSLVRGVSGLIGVVLNQLGNQHHTGIVDGVEARARELSASVLIGHGGHSEAELRRQIDTMIELRVDGLVIVSSWVPREVLERAGAEVPTVVVTQIADPPPVIDTIASDDILGARLAVEHLIASGRSRIGYLSRSLSATSQARVQGVQLALADANLPSCLIQIASGEQIDLQRLLDERDLDALLCNNDLTAAEVIRLAHQQSIPVPDRLSVIGYDNTHLTELLYPSLTSIDQPQAQMGRRAVDALVERGEGRTEPLREFYTPSLVARASTTDL